ncbi:ABC transporter ATP-binding protein [Actinomadura roseirufa]|uniref:ABC transporter ATP-binding protein n=1 Tax=Actinomadura roseirufa TaxID=2094049 RepID=UPI00104137B0|nr:ATP-binding cassette domain-containing protein [Actinomadura roseirufa]
MSTPVISTRGLTRTFTARTGPVHAVRGIDLSVAPGEILGLLGPNGAGKTTTLRMLTTLLPPTGGEAEIAGHDLRRDPAGVRRRIGYVAQSGGLDPACPVGEELVTQGRLHRLPRAQARERAAELAADLDLTGLMERPTAALSGGQRRRVEIALGLVNRPDVLFLDEPTTGLDPAARADLWDLVRRVRDERGTTVFLTTHYLDEADALADRVVIVDGGTIVAEGSPAELKERYAGDPAAGLQDAFLAITGRGAVTENAPIAI